MRFLKLLIAVSLCLILALAVFAHPGGTDSSGGHYDRSTREYHYHHGYSAHQHYDKNGDGILDCPYAFDDKTGSSSGSSSSAKPTTEPTIKADYPPFIPTIPTVTTDYIDNSITSAIKSNTEKSKTTFEQIWEAVCWLWEFLVYSMIVFFCGLYFLVILGLIGRLLKQLFKR